MTPTEYLEKSAKTMAEQTEQNRFIATQNNDDIKTLIKASYLADAFKRKVYYLDTKVSERYVNNLNNIDIFFADNLDKISDVTDLTQEQFDFLHAALGLLSESGEVLEEIFKSFIEGRQVNLVNMKEEVGDLLWYIAILCRLCGFSFEEAMDRNIAKLAKRYPNKFNTQDAVNRDLDAELKVLENCTIVPDRSVTTGKIKVYRTWSDDSLTGNRLFSNESDAFAAATQEYKTLGIEQKSGLSFSEYIWAGYLKIEEVVVE